MCDSGSMKAPLDIGCPICHDPLPLMGLAHPMRRPSITPFAGLSSTARRASSAQTQDHSVNSVVGGKVQSVGFNGPTHTMYNNGDHGGWGVGPAIRVETAKSLLSKII